MVETFIQLGLWGAIVTHVVHFRSSYAKIIGTVVGGRVTVSMMNAIDPNKGSMMKTASGCLIATSILELLVDTLNWIQ